MLRTNSKKVREAVRAYVTKTTSICGIDPETFGEAAAIIGGAWDGYKYPALSHRFATVQDAFMDWASGLPLDTFDYIATGDTVKLVGDMLEETEEERSKYSDSQACDLLTYLIFREVGKVHPIEF